MKNAHRFYIDGDWIAPEILRRLEVIDPSTEQAIGTVAIGSAADAARAINAAARGGSQSVTPRCCQ